MDTAKSKKPIPKQAPVDPRGNGQTPNAANGGASISPPQPVKKDEDEARPRKKKSVVEVHIPNDFTLRHDDGTHTDYKAGPAEMPEEHVEHWYAKAHGVKRKGAPAEAGDE